jgi:hypothetical protein
VKSPVPADCTSYAMDIGRLSRPRRTVRLGLARRDAPLPIAKQTGSRSPSTPELDNLQGPGRPISRSGRLVSTSNPAVIAPVLV